MPFIRVDFVTMYKQSRWLAGKASGFCFGRD